MLGMPAVKAQVSVQGGTASSCNVLVMDLTRHWLEVKNHMLPPAEVLEKPENNAFVCVSRYNMTNAQERRVASSGNFRCFDLPFSRGLGVCCDSRGYECAQLHPGLFPDLVNRGRNSEQYEPPKSQWVKPPSESEQWGTN